MGEVMLFLFLWEHLLPYAIALWTRRWFRIFSYLLVFYWVVQLLQGAGH